MSSCPLHEAGEDLPIYAVLERDANKWSFLFTESKRFQLTQGLAVGIDQGPSGGRLQKLLSATRHTGAWKYKHSAE